MSHAHTQPSEYKNKQAQIPTHPTQAEQGKILSHLHYSQSFAALFDEGRAELEGNTTNWMRIG